VEARTLSTVPETVFLLICLSLLGIFVGGCGKSNSGSSAADSQFVASIHLAAPDIGTYRSDTELIHMAHAACDGFKSGASYEQLADRLTLLEGRNPLPSQDLGALIDSSVNAYCPRFLSNIS
jgi:hypothetical protein